MECLKSFIIFISIILSFSNCSKKENVNFEMESPQVQIIKTHEFHISGVVEEDFFHYEQINYEDINISNKYFLDYQETWLQAYGDTTLFLDKYCEIRFHDLDIHNLNLPHQILENQGSLLWYDSEIDSQLVNHPKCQGLDRDFCSFILLPENGLITITNVTTDSIIEGTFEGQFNLVGLNGFNLFSDESKIKNITNGEFRIKYRIE